jgi:S1-C subfamily serine protease
MVKRFWGWGLLVLVLPFFCIIFAQDQGSDVEDVYYGALVNTVKIYYFSPYRTIYGTEGVDIITGSGVMLNGNEILSCFHVLDQFPAGKISVVQFTENKQNKREGDQVQIIAHDARRDLLLLRIDPPFQTEGIQVAAGSPALGSEVIITGHTELPVTRLRLYRYLESAKGIMVTPVYVGDSGGGVFNAQGRLIGIVQICLMLERQPTLYGFAIPLQTLQEFLNERPMRH